MKLIQVIIILASLSTLVNSDCLDLKKEWKGCSDDMYPRGPLDNSSCEYNVHTFTKVIIIHNTYKVSAVYCQNDTFPGDIFDCLPLENSRRFVLTDCPFKQDAFHKFFHNSTLDELIVRYKNSSIFHSSLYLHQLPYFQFLSLINIRTFSYFDLRLYSLPYLKSIKISNFTFSRLPAKPFEELSRLKGISLTNGRLDNLPDGFLHGINLVHLDLSSNKLKNFQPGLLRNMKELRKLNLSHNFLENVDENLFKDTHALKVVTFAYNRISSLPSRLFRTTSTIKVLLLNNNELREIPEDIFQGLQQLIVLKLSHNHLTFLPSNVLKDAKALTALELQCNQLRSVAANVFPFPSVLREIDLSNNKIKTFTSSAPFGNNNYLTKINMSNNRLEEFMVVDWSLYNLEQLDLSNNFIQQVTIPMSEESGGGNIFLQNNKIHTVTITRRVTSNYTYFLSGNPFNCNCNLTNFVSSLASVGDADKLVCEEPWYQAGKHIKDFKNNTSQLCETKNDCPFMCRCHLLSSDQVEVDCRSTGVNADTILHLPRRSSILYLEGNNISSLTGLVDETWRDLNQLYISNNSLTSLQGWTIPAGLKLLAVDENKLKELPFSVMDTVNKSENFSIYLNGNDWPCDCQSIFMDWFVENLDKIKDAKITYCKLHEAVDQILLAELGCSNSRSSMYRSCSNMYKSISIILYSLLISLNKIF